MTTLVATLERTELGVPDDEVESLRAQVHGTVLTSSDAGGAAPAREVFNAMHPGKPGARRPVHRHGRRRRPQSTSPASTACWSRCAAAATRSPACPHSTAAC